MPPHFLRENHAIGLYETVAMAMKIAVLSMISIALTGCAGTAPGDAGPPSPDAHYEGAEIAWNQSRFDNADDKFTFAIFSDLTGGERDRIFEIAIAQLNLLRPEMIITVGDLIEGDSGTEAGFNKEWDSFDVRAMRARAPVFYVGGNHDLTGKMLRDTWRKRYGPTYYHFVYRNVLFLVLDTEDNTPERIAEIEQIRNEGLRIIDERGWDAFNETEYATLPERRFGNVTPEQKDYIVRAIVENPNVRWTFLFMHKAIWTSPTATEFAAIEKSLSDRPYTVFFGHHHVYSYAERNGRDYIGLATTGGLQFPETGLSVDHVTLVTVDDNGADIANIEMGGIRDKSGLIPLGGDDVCFDASECSTESAE